MWGKAKFTGTTISGQFTQNNDYWIVGPYPATGYMLLDDSNVPTAVGGSTFATDWQLTYLIMPVQIYP
jgi:hypothetical protein